MFPKPAFGSNTSGFGSFSAPSTAASPFGGFKPAGGTGAFGAPPAFGAAATPQPATGGLFGSTTNTGGLFGAAPAAAPTFGATNAGFNTFGARPQSTGLFNTPNSGLFTGTTNTGFAAKPAGFGFGSTATTGTTGGGLFGSTQAPSTGLFGQQTNNMSGGGLFANNSGAFGQQQTAAGTGHVKYNPVVGTDVVVKSGASQNINIKHHCITCMKEYEGKSLEELRLEDYTAGRKGAQGGGVFGFQQPAEQKPALFGPSTFGQPAATTSSSVFGAGGLNTSGGFGQTNTFSFGSNAQNNTTTSGLFGAAKPAFGAPSTSGASLFGATTTQAPTFGTATPSFGFGSNTQTQGGGLFAAKPATSGFGTTPASTGFGSTFGTAGGGLFGAKPAQSAAPAFGTTTPAFGALGSSGGFGASTTTSGLFGGNTTFGKPPTTQSAFGFNAPATGLNTSAGFGANSFAMKPAAPTFGNLGGGSLFQQPAQNTFNPGGTSVGGGIFGGQSTLGSTGLGLGGIGTNTGLANNTVGGASAAGNVHEQILNLVARPYGDSALFRDLLPDTSTTAEDVLKPTNALAMKAVLEGGAAYRVTSPSTDSRIKLHHAPTLPHDKKSLFDGLEESDASLEDKLTLKPSRKRLVLRPKQQEDNAPPTALANNNRSLEETSLEQNGECERDGTNIRRSIGNAEQGRQRKDAPSIEENNNHDGSGKYPSWLTSPRVQSSEKEKPIDGEPTPRIYPNLDKELPLQISERRASWLTTKTLRKPPNPETEEYSIRDLGLRPERSHDKENIDTLSVSEEEHVSPRELPPHPTGVKLTRPGYYTIPSLDEMIKYMRPDGTCVVPHLTIGRRNYGNVYYDCEIDVKGLDLDELVHFLNKEVTVYPDDSDKPAVGEGLNRRAIVTLDRIWPRDKTEKRPITDPERLIAMDYEGKLRRVCDKHDTKFIEYRPQTGSWVFRVEHFSKYSLTDSDEEDDITPEVMKRQLVNQQLQKAAPIAPTRPPPLATGLGGEGGPLASLGHMSAASDQLAMHHTSLNLLNGKAKAFEMDTTEDNAESQSMYQDSHRAFGVKSPTSELARLEHRQSHNVQLMKASLYADTEMEEDASVSTEDQLVPGGSLMLAPPRAASTRDAADLQPEEIAASLPLQPVYNAEEVQMKPLIVRPDTVVLKYHRKVPPFKQTIAGRLDAACIADMCVCRARHSRVGFGPSGQCVYTTTYDAVSDQPHNADLCDMGRYVGGRATDDWSEPVVVRLAYGQTDTHNDLQETISRQLETLLEFSTFAECAPDLSPRLVVKTDPRDRRETLARLVRDSSHAAGNRARFGVTGAYCHEIFKLCEALWAADLENDGVPGTDEMSIVNRHRRFLEWLTEAVKETTDHELSKPSHGEDVDESDGHSGRIWTLLLGGRVLEACKVARENGDLNVAALIAQAAGDSSFRTLVSRQLSLWRECGADSLICWPKMAALQLVAGVTSPRDRLVRADWMRVLHATARFLCPQVPTLEQVIRTYESFFPASASEMEDDDRDLSIVRESESEDMGAKYPLPPYMGEFDVSINKNGKSRRVLDLRYELIRARAMNTRPRLHPAAYTPDPMDYSLCFVLGAWLGSPSVESVTGLAEQMEARGAWHLAIQALAYHPDDVARSHLIRSVLSRHAPARADSADLERLGLVSKLRVPDQWVLMARAHRAKYEHLPALEAEYLVGAGAWNAAHKVLIEQLLPDAVLSDKLDSISSILESLAEAAERHEVSNWESGGQALHHYIHVCNEIRGLVSSETAPSGVSCLVESLRPRVVAACRALAALPQHTPRAAAARTEMGSRLVQLALAAGEPPHQLAALLRALRLPPDCTLHAQNKITSDLADQAADLCIESTTSSPLSSHHRTTVQS